MSWFSTMLSGGVDKIVDSVGTAVDKIVTSDEERLILKNELIKIQLEAKQKQDELEVQFEQQITDRWKSDNEHFITRLVRPLSVVFMLVLFGMIVLLDGNVGMFLVNPAYVPVIENLLVTMIFAYFGSRGAEKIFTKNKSKT